MSTTSKHVPTHRAERAATAHPFREVRRRTLTTVAALSSVAVLATGLGDRKSTRLNSSHPV